jgi:uncharacterized delta-60 repeat protein
MSVVLEQLDSRLLFSAGTLDATFGQDGIAYQRLPGEFAANEVVDMEVDSSGRTILVTGRSDRLIRLHSDGTLDQRFGKNGIVSARSIGVTAGITGLLALPDGSMLVGGSLVPNEHRVVKISPRGRFDHSFGGGDAIAELLPSGTSRRMLAGPDEKLLISSGDDRLTRLNADGSVDQGFGDPQEPGTIDVTPEFPDLTHTGSQDFQLTLEHFAHITRVRLASDGKLYVGVNIELRTTDPDNNIKFDNAGSFVLRLNADGSIDHSYGQSGRFTPAYPSPFNLNGLRDFALLSDGSLIIEGQALVKFTAGGGLDGTFSDNGVATLPAGILPAGEIVSQSDGKLLVAGYSTKGDTHQQVRTHLLRFNSDGQLDRSFGEAGTLTIAGKGRNGTLITPALGPDGSIYVGFKSGKNHSTSGVDDLASITTYAAVARVWRDDGPAGIASAGNLTAPPTSSFKLKVVWRDAIGIDSTSVDDDDIQIIAPDGSSLAARIVTYTPTTGIGVYKVPAPGGGSWNSSDNGQYRLRIRPGGVKNSQGVFATSRTIGSLLVALS